MIETERQSVTVLLFERLARQAGLRHLVTTRRIHGADVDFAPDLQDADDRKRIAGLLGLPGASVVCCHQVHGDRVIVLEQHHVSADARPIHEGDSLVTAEPGVALAVKGADCPLVLLYDPRAPALGLVHSGWRSTITHIVRNALDALATHFLTRPGDVLVGIAPSIRGCCYEVSEELAARFEQAFSCDVVVQRAPKPHLDLARAIRADLVDRGVPPGQIETSPLCTSCRNDLLHSHRREGAGAGRNILAAALA